jgi:hypothetical protein
VFVLMDDRMEIYEVISSNENASYKLIKRAVHIAHNLSCKSIYITIGSRNNFIKRLRKCFFINTRYNMKLYHLGEQDLYQKDWMFFAGDRNI